MQALRVPLPPSEVLGLSVHSSATTASDFLGILSNLDIKVDCENCTIFVPTNDAIRAANLSSYSTDEQRAIVQGHFLLNTIAYSTTIQQGSILVTASGSTLAYGVNATGPFIVGNQVTASILRTNIIARSSVIHVGLSMIPLMIVDQHRHPQYSHTPGRGRQSIL